MRTRIRQGPEPSGPWGQGQWGKRTNHNQTTSRPSRAKSPYKVLGVPPGASRSEITAKYRDLVQQHHPDKVAHLGSELRELAEQRMKQINAAYDHLKRHSIR